MAKNWTTTNQLELDPRDIIDGSVIYRSLEKSDIRTKRYAFHLYPSAYGRMYFLVYMGKLRQFKVIRTYVCPWNYTFTHNGKRVVAIHELEICGVGKVFVAHNDGSGTNFVCKIYDSVEDYKNEEESYLGYNADNLEELQPFTSSLVHEHSYFSNYDYVVKVWRWNGMRAVAECATKVPSFYSFDGKNLEIPNAENYALPKGRYKTKEECEKDNTFEVECFGEKENTEKKDVEVEVTIASVTMKVKESQLDDVIKYIKGLK
jgi:hypothetical protein